MCVYIYIYVYIYMEIVALLDVSACVAKTRGVCVWGNVRRNVRVHAQSEAPMLMALCDVDMLYLYLRTVGGVGCVQDALLARVKAALLLDDRPVLRIVCGKFALVEGI